MTFPVGTPTRALPFVLSSASVSDVEITGAYVLNGETLTVDCAPWSAISSGNSTFNTPTWFGVTTGTFDQVLIGTGTALTIFVRGSGVTSCFLRIYGDSAPGDTTPVLMSEYALNNSTPLTITHAWFPCPYLRVTVANVGTTGVGYTNLNLVVSSTGAS